MKLIIFVICLVQFSDEVNYGKKSLIRNFFPGNKREMNKILQAVKYHEAQMRRKSSQLDDEMISSHKETNLDEVINSTDVTGDKKVEGNGKKINTTKLNNTITQIISKSSDEQMEQSNDHTSIQKDSEIRYVEHDSEINQDKTKNTVRYDAFGNKIDKNMNENDEEQERNISNNQKSSKTERENKEQTNNSPESQQTKKLDQIGNHNTPILTDKPQIKINNIQSTLNTDILKKIDNKNTKKIIKTNPKNTKKQEEDTKSPNQREQLPNNANNLVNSKNEGDQKNNILHNIKNKTEEANQIENKKDILNSTASSQILESTIPQNSMHNTPTKTTAPSKKAILSPKTTETPQIKTTLNKQNILNDINQTSMENAVLTDALVTENSEKTQENRHQKPEETKSTRNREKTRSSSTIVIVFAFLIGVVVILVSLVPCSKFKFSRSRYAGHTRLVTEDEEDNLSEFNRSTFEAGRYASRDRLIN